MGGRRNIVLCSDGTGNRGGLTRSTNVWRLFKAVDLHGHKTDFSKQEQIAFYNDGVGTDRFKPLRILGGAFGWGLTRNMRELYTFLVKNYQPGDRLFLIGFSRGAYTVRALAGMIDLCGVVDSRGLSDRDLQRLIRLAFRAYKSAYRCRPELAAEFKRAFGVEVERDGDRSQEIDIHFIGVWDTVDAVGMPVDELASALDAVFRFRFYTHKLSGHVAHAYHALSLDDKRQTFHPVLWDESDKPPEQTVEQVWFAGVHGNVGGGYPKDEMALVSLDWMMDKAHACGLRFTDGAWEQIQSERNVHSRLYNSRSGLAVYYRYNPRDMAEHCGRKGVTPKVHVSVMDRIIRSTDDYAPLAIPQSYQLIPEPSVGTIPAPHRETRPAQRAEAVDRARDAVWWRRLNYFGFVALSLVTLGLGLLWWDAPLIEVHGVLEWPFTLLEVLLPAFAEPWINGYRHHPGLFLGLIGGLAVLFFISTQLRSRIERIAHEGWRVGFGYPGQQYLRQRLSLAQAVRTAGPSQRFANMKTESREKGVLIGWLTLLGGLALVGGLAVPGYRLVAALTFPLLGGSAVVLWRWLWCRMVTSGIHSAIAKPPDRTP